MTFLPWLLLLSAAGGAAALIYEIVWFQFLQLIIGSSAISLGVLLAAFMGGMCAGSLAAPRAVPAGLHPLRVYAAIEGAIGVCGLAALWAVPYVDRLYAALAPGGLRGIVLRAAVCAVCLLAPTMLMGAALPTLARWTESTPRGISSLGLVYSANIAGAVAGCLLAGFYLLRVYDTAAATYAAAALNASAAAGAAALAWIAPHCAAAPIRPAETRGSGAVFLAIGLSGFCALGAEVVWTRLLSLMLGATVYTFSIILAVFLAGLGMGGAAGALLAREGNPRHRLAWCQAGLAAAIAWAAAMIAHSLPYWPIDPALAKSPWLVFQVDLARCLSAIFPAACLWGASFPLALAAAASPGAEPGRLAGRTYAANTAGAILGALGFSLALVPWLGTQRAGQLLVALSCASALVLLRRWSIALGLLLVWFVPAVPWGVTAFGRKLVSETGAWELLYQGEGRNASIAITRFEDGQRFFHISGKTEASSEPHDMRLERLLGHVPALIHAGPRSALVVGCGAGVTAGSLVPHPELERIVICELEPLIPPVVAVHFGSENHHVLRDPRTRLVYDDARHFILTTREKFDLITSDPIHPWVKGSATLYSKEYFELVKRRLNPGGVVSQWVPLYESDPEAVKSEIATFAEVFPDATLWTNYIPDLGIGYDIVLLGTVDGRGIDARALERRLARADHADVVRSLRGVAFEGTAADLLAAYAGSARDLAPWLRGAPINRDRNLRLQYIAGWGLDRNRSVQIFDALMRYRQPLR